MKDKLIGAIVNLNEAIKVAKTPLKETLEKIRDQILKTTGELNG